MSLTRRQFAMGMGAGLMMLPLTRRKAAAATTRAPIRFVSISSVGMLYNDWAPLSSPGAAVKLNTGNAALSSALANIMLIGGLPMPFLGESHGTYQHTTGVSLSTAYMATSLETVVANALYANASQPSMLLGASAKDGTYFLNNGTRLQTIDSPLDAFTLAFPNGAPIKTAVTAGYQLPRSNIAALVQKQIASLSGRVGPAEQKKLAMYAQSLAKVSPSSTATGGTTTGGTTTASTGTTGGTTAGTTTSGTGTTVGTTGTTTSGGGGGCAPQAPNMNGVTPTNTASTAAVGQLQMQLIPSLFACDITRVVGMQWGVSATQTLTTSVDTSDEHSNWHSGDDRETARVAQENYLCTCFANLVNTLQQTPDPVVPGSSILDNTLIVWVRDIGNAPDHTQNAVPVVMAGATGYLKYNGAGGTYYNLAGQGTVLNLLLSVLEGMAVPFGNFGNPNGAQTGQALQAIKL